MTYLEINFTITDLSDDKVEILQAWLSDLPFESFLETDSGMNAYIQKDNFSLNSFKDIIKNINDIDFSSEITEIQDQNWNKSWEENYYEPILIDDRCLIRGSKHETKQNVEYEILINPKMSFGSGHHQTTRLMVSILLELDLNNKSVLDMGCGTGILSILAGMKKASSILAVDIDNWAVENTKENINLNNQDNIQVELGGIERISNKKFDLILANINTNILLQYMKDFYKSLNPEGMLIMSGFYTEDKFKIIESAELLGFSKLKEYSIENWNAIIFKLA